MTNSLYSAKGPIWVQWVLIGVYAVCTAFVSYRHEPYFDELHAWVIVLQSKSLAAVHANKVYEGHPDAWYFVLYLLNLVTKEFLWVKFIHLSMNVCAMFLLVRFAPFSTLMKGLLLFSYLFAYEYAIVNRNYAIGILLVFLICYCFQYRHSIAGYLILCMLFMLQMQTSLMGVLLGCALYSTLLLEVLFYRQDFLRINWLSYALGFFIVVAGLVFFYESVSPPADVNLYWVDTKLTLERFFWTISYFNNAFIQVPANAWYFWNTSLLDTIANISLQLVVKCLLALVIFYLIALPLLRSRLARVGWIMSCLAIVAFLYTKYPGIFRHHGHFLVSFICFMWIQPQLPDYKKIETKPVNTLYQVAERSWLTLLFIQVLVCGFVSYQEICRPFSMNKWASNFLADPKYANYFLAGYLDHIGESIAAYRPGFRMYYPSSDRQGGFMRNDSKVRFRTAKQMTEAIRKRTTRPAILILNGPLPQREANSVGLVPLQYFVGSILGDEQFMLYELK